MAEKHIKKCSRMIQDGDWDRATDLMSKMNQRL
jgi:hypothetical protein